MRADAAAASPEKKKKKTRGSSLLRKSRAQEIADIRHQAQKKALTSLRAAYTQFAVPEDSTPSFSQRHRKLGLGLGGALSASLPSRASEEKQGEEDTQKEILDGKDIDRQGAETTAVIEGDAPPGDGVMESNKSTDSDEIKAGSSGVGGYSFG